MYDKVNVSFEDGTSTILFVGVDDSIQDALAALESETGVAVANYEIIEVTYVEQTDFTPDDW